MASDSSESGVCAQTHTERPSPSSAAVSGVPPPPDGVPTASALSSSSAKEAQEPPSHVQGACAADSSASSRAKGSVAALMARFQSSPAPAPSSSPTTPPRKAATAAAHLSPLNPAKELRQDNSLSSSAATEEEVAAAIQLPFMAASEGAVSLTEPDATIANPFRSSRPQTPTPETGWSDDGDTTGARDKDAEPGPSQSDAIVMSPASNRFSFVSLTSTVDQSEVQDDLPAKLSRHSLYPRPPSKAISPLGDYIADSSPSDYGSSSGMQERFLLSRIEETDSNRSSTAGMEILRENFEKIHRQSKRHTRTASDMTKSGAPIAEEETEVQNPDATVPIIPVKQEEEEAEESDGVNWDFWGRVMNNYQEIAHENPGELSRAIQVGIPAQLRGLCWQLLSASKDPELEIIYAWYIRQKASPHDKQIKKDLNRTFPEQEYFKDGRVGQENLYNVVKAYSLYDEEVGYVQGMGFIVGPLLLNMPDEEAFSILARLMKSYGLRSHFLPNMPGLQLRLFQFDRLLEDMLPLLHRHLTREGIKTSHYATQWFMTLFSYRSPLNFVYRVLDSVFAEGIEAIFRFAVALMSRAEEDLLTLNFEQALAYLKNASIFERYKLPGGTYDADRFSRDAYATQVQSHSLDNYASEFEESVKVATAHRRELEAARIINRNLTAKVSELEDQLEKLQGEHVELVRDVVLSKVAKEETEEELIRYKMLYAELVLQADQAGSNESMRISRQSSLQAPSPTARGSTGSNGLPRA